MKALLVVLVVLLYSARAGAEDLGLDDPGLRAIPPGDDVIMAVKKGGKVPFDGQIFDINTAIRWGNWLTVYRERLEDSENRAKRLCQMEIRYQEQIYAIEVERYTRLSTDLEKRLLRSEQARVRAEHERDNPPFYKSFLFGLGVGVVSMSAVVLIGSQAF